MNAPQQLPAYLQNKTSRGLAQSLIGNLGAGSPPFLSIMGNRFTLIDGVGEEIAVPTYDPKIGPYIDVCVIDALERTSKIYYDKPYDPAASQYEPPACWSDNGVGPSRNASVPQSRTCAECPKGAWGSKVSAVSGKGVKACNDVQKIAFIYQGYEMPFLLRVPPNSRTNFRGYVNKFVGQPMDIADVTTRIMFEPGGIGTLKFEAVGWLDETTTVPQRDKLIAAKATDAMIGRTDLPRQEALPAPAQAPQLEAPALQSAPFVPPTTAAPPAAFPPPTTGAPPPPQIGPGLAAASPSDPAPQQRRRRRTAAEMQAANQAPNPASQQVAPPPSQPAPFMPQPAQMQPAPTAQNGAFGIAPGAAPNPEMSKVLDGLFGPAK